MRWLNCHVVVRSNHDRQSRQDHPSPVRSLVSQPVVAARLPTALQQNICPPNEKACFFRLQWGTWNVVCRRIHGHGLETT